MPPITLFNVEYKLDEIVFSQVEKDEMANVLDKKRLASRAIQPDDFKLFKEWIHNYNHALKQRENKSELLALGKSMFAWLNGEQDIFGKIFQACSHPLMIEFQVPKNASERQGAFLEAPWELLANENGHLAMITKIFYSPVRRIGDERPAKPAPSPYKLNTVFMAASPRDVKPELNYEREERAVLNLRLGQEPLDMYLFVEESGNLARLSGFVHERKPVDVVHISCHGNVFFDGAQKSGRAFLSLENLEGDHAPTTTDDFCRAFSQNRPPLLFLSACKTAETHIENGDAGETAFVGFAHEVVGRGFAAALGWSGSVSDSEATRFAESLYWQLSCGATVCFQTAKTDGLTTSETLA